jgi:hypothetical protein
MSAHLELRKNGTGLKRATPKRLKPGEEAVGETSTAAGCWFIAATIVRPWRDVSEFLRRSGIE